MDKVIKEYMAKLGRKGGPARASRLSPQKRKQIAQIAARKRWDNHNDRLEKEGKRKK